jgi:hypothetical protein
MRLAAAGRWQSRLEPDGLRLTLRGWWKREEPCRLPQLLLGTRERLLLRVVLGRMLEAKNIVRGTFERDVKGTPIETDLELRGPVLMSRMPL